MNSETPNSRLEAIQKECLICLENKADAVILNCGHGGICFDCASKIVLDQIGARCHLCRKVRFS